MNKQELKDKIGEQIERNIYYMTAVSTNVSTTKEFEKNIHLLHEASIKMNEDSDEYNRGLNDAWKLTRKIGGVINNGAYDCDELEKIFDEYETYDIFDKFTYQEALAKVEEYEKKKAEEAAKPVRGDIVKVTDKRNSSYNYGIYLGDDYYYDAYSILGRGSYCAGKYNKASFTLEKTCQHVDLDGWFKETEYD